MKTNIALIGFSGCGKTTIGKRLAELRNYAFADTDEEIETQTQTSITKIFEQHGEPRFRELEVSAIKNISSRENTIIATGGGCVKNPANVQNLSANGTIVYLKSSAEKIFQNIKSDVTRPLLASEEADDKLEKIKSMLKERTPLYEKYAQITVDITNLSANEAAAAVNNILEFI